MRGFINWNSSIMVLLLVRGASGSTETIGPNGINSAGLGLTGAGVSIGQVEVARPGKRVADGGPDMPANANANIVPADVFLRNGMAVANMHIDEHAEQVAGIMISTDATDGLGMFMNGIAPTGVATGAALYSSAYNVPMLPGQPEAALSAQHIALQDGGDVRAINMSFGEFLVDGHILDGNSLLTQLVDWSARVHDVLYVVAGNQGNNIPVPKDEYNGVTVARSSKIGAVYRQVSAGNTYDEDAFGVRTSIDLLAPGDGIEVAQLNGEHGFVNGTSFSTPHVTGTVALLQEFGDERIMNAGAPRWDADARRHEVMKAVLLNSADKIQDTGDGNLLGMTRTVLDQGGDDWLDSNAFSDETIPLDIQLGAGHLNASRALKQFRNGEFDSDAADVPVIGWDYGQTSGDEGINKYAISQSLKVGSYIAITLAWDREVLFDNDADMDGEYDIGDTFVADCCLTDLELYLMPAGETDFEANETSSISANSSIEHIFYPIAEPGQYEIWVRQFNSPFGDPQDYALSWWSVPAMPAIAQGDYDGSGVVDSEDYRVWRANFGTASPMGDGNGNSVVDAADYVVWRNNLGQQLGSGGVLGTAVPEPASAMLLLVAAAVLVARPRGVAR